jgi:tRNA (cytidine/uridine-2'-O-)-methyltransferase
MNIVLVQPEIPQNTGNIARSCVATGSTLHLVEPLGFSLEDKYLRRAGMDYWKDLALQVHRSLDDFFRVVSEDSCLFVTKKAPRDHTRVRYVPEGYLLFGCESVGLPEDLLSRNRERCVRIPMRPGVRSLNLSSAAAVVLYEAERQLGFPELSTTGKLAAGN